MNQIPLPKLVKIVADTNAKSTDRDYAFSLIMEHLGNTIKYHKNIFRRINNRDPNELDLIINEAVLVAIVQLKDSVSEDGFIAYCSKVIEHNILVQWKQIKKFITLPVDPAIAATSIDPRSAARYKNVETFISLSNRLNKKEMNIVNDLLASDVANKHMKVKDILSKHNISYREFRDIVKKRIGEQLKEMK